jgi:hypothetical protein
MKFQLAQINVAKLLEPIESPLLEDFVSELDRINQLAEESPGFVYRLKDEDINSNIYMEQHIQGYIVNISVWADVDSLKNFTYNSGHIEVFRKRSKWFHRSKEPHIALWWIEAESFPSAETAMARLKFLIKHGETPKAFTFRKPFDPPN